MLSVWFIAGLFSCLGTEDGLKSVASSTENSLVGDQRGSGRSNSPNEQRGARGPNIQQGSGRSNSPNELRGARGPNIQQGSERSNSPNDQPDVGTTSSGILTPPLTDPIQRRAKGVGFDRNRAGSDSRNVKREAAGTGSTGGASGRFNGAESGGAGSRVAATKSDITLSSRNPGVSEMEEHHRGVLLKQSNVSANISDPSRSLPSQAPSAPGAGSQAASVQKPSGKDQPDLGASGYIAKLRARGHRRSASAPAHSLPAPPPQVVEPPPSEGGDSESNREKKVREGGR